MTRRAYHRFRPGSPRGAIHLSRPGRERAPSSSSSSELCVRRLPRPGRGVSALSFSLRSPFRICLLTFNFKLSTFNLLPTPSSRIAPFPQPEYPLFSRGGLGCESVRQGSGSALEASSQLFFGLLYVFHFVPRRTRSSSIRNFIPKCAGAASDRSAEAALWPSPACLTSPTFSTWPPSTAASGRPPISATPGIQSLTTSPAVPSARWPLLLPTRTLFMLAAAKDCSAPISRPAMVFTNPPTPENPGRTSACATHSKSCQSSSIRKIPIVFSSPPKDIPTVRTPNAAFSVPPTVDKLSRKFSTKMKTPALPISLSIPQIRRRFTRCCGRHALRLGKFAAALRSIPQGADSSNLPMAEALGGRLQKDCPPPPRNSAASESPLLLRNPIDFTPASKPSAASAASIAPTMPV